MCSVHSFMAFFLYCFRVHVVRKGGLKTFRTTKKSAFYQSVGLVIVDAVAYGNFIVAKDMTCNVMESVAL